ncbi:vacuolar protein sorting protein, partial [Reticulomyxa filosa]
IFLQETLSRTRAEDKSQRTMLATWLTELHLAKISETEEMDFQQHSDVKYSTETAAASTTSSQPPSSMGKIEKTTLSQCKDVVFDLIASYGRTQQLIKLGEIQNDWAWIIRYYIEHGQMKEAIKRLSSLTNPNQHEQLYYDFVPVLMHAYPKETIDMIIQIKVLDPKKLIPALMRFESDQEFKQSLKGLDSTDINDELLQQSKQQNNVMRPIHTDNHKGMDFDFDEKSVPGLQQPQVNSMDFQIEEEDNHDNHDNHDHNDHNDYDDDRHHDDDGKHKKNKKNRYRVTNGHSVVVNNKNSIDDDNRQSTNLDVINIQGRERGTARTALTISQEHTRQAVRYLEDVVRSNLPQSKDPAVHNYLITLYCKHEDERPLLKFIDWQGDEPHYDTKYALRLCHQEKRTKSCVRLYEKMGLYEEAVNLALNVPDNLFELARSVVENLKRKEPMAADEQKKLWLIIARYVVKDSQEDLDQALSLINESKCLSIEDILPYLSDFTNIGLFKPEIKSSLERYSVNIKKLQDHMKTYTDTAEEIRKDTDTLRQRSTFFFSNKKCSLSQLPVLLSNYLLFPCRHMFRLDAVVRKIISHYNMDESAMRSNEVLEMAYKECPLCGKLMLEEVQKPFIDWNDPKDLETAHSWKITYHYFVIVFFLASFVFNQKNFFCMQLILFFYFVKSAVE